MTKSLGESIANLINITRKAREFYKKYPSIKNCNGVVIGSAKIEPMSEEQRLSEWNKLNK